MEEENSNENDVKIIKEKVDLLTTLVLDIKSKIERTNLASPNINGDNGTSGGSQSGVENEEGNTDSEENVELQKDLKYFFSSPWEKHKASCTLPCKVIVQVLKVVFISIQLCHFIDERANFVEYVENNNIAMKHMYLPKWDPSNENMYAIYTTDDLVDHINFAMNQFSQTETLTLGSVMFEANSNDTTSYFNMCVEQYREGKVFKNDTYLFNQQIVKDCLDLSPVLVYNTTTNTTEPKFDIKAILNKHNTSFSFERILQIELKFHLRSIRLALEKKVHKPECYWITGKIVFDDTDKDGQMIVNLYSSLKEFKCSGKLASVPDDDGDKNGTLFDGFVISLCIISFSLCILSLYKARKLQCKTGKLKNITLSRSDKCEFVNLWYVLIVISDCMCFSGSIMKILLDHRLAESSSTNYDICALLLGSGIFLVYTGFIRYIGYIEKFNILTVVLKKAFPDMMRFLVTSLLLYLGFLMCGWTVLGPYHYKFRSLSTVSECLFSLINGDDMFATFSATVDENRLIWYFSRLYLYFFICLFVYAVLNLFIAVILDTYETTKRDDDNPKSELTEFIDAYKGSIEKDSCTKKCFRKARSCFKRDNLGDNSRDNSVDNSETPTERTPLVPGQRDSAV